MTDVSVGQSVGTTDEWGPTTPRSAAAFVVIAPRASRGTQFAAGEVPRTIGREGNVAFDAEGLSREHASVWVEDGSTWIEDRDSTNGTYVNGRRLVGRVALRGGDVIGLGALELAFNAGPAPQSFGRAQSSGEREARTETTRYLCAATELDERFCRRVLDQVVGHPYRALGRSFGVDVAAVARHAIAARRRLLVRDVCLTVVLAIVVATVASQLLGAGPTDAWSDTAADLLPWLAVLLALAWLVVTVETWIRRAWVLPRLMYGRFDAARTQPRMGTSLSRQLAHISDAGAGNVTVFSGLNPFVGSGVRVDGWSFAIDVTKGRRDPETGEPRAPKPFGAEDLHLHLAPGLARLGLPNLDVSERLFIHGMDVASDRRLLPDPMSVPETHVDLDVVRAPLRNPESAARSYLCLEAVGWQGNLVVTMFVRAVRLPGTLFMEANSFVLLPLRREYYRIDAIRPQAPLEALPGSLLSGLANVLPRLLASPVRAVGEARRSRLLSRRRKDQRWAISHGKMLDYGAHSTVREDAMSDDLNPYFLLLDQEMYVKVAQERLLAEVSEFLSARGVDLAEFGRQQTIINQNQTVTYDIRNPSGTGYAIGHQAQGTVHAGGKGPGR